MLSLGSPHKASQSTTWEGFHSQDFHHLGFVTKNLFSPRGFEDSHAVGHQLKQVLVPGDDDDLHFLFVRGVGKGAQDVVCLEAFLFDHRQVMRLAEFPYVRELRFEFGRELRPVGFVFLEKLVAKRGGRSVESHGHVVGGVGLKKLPERSYKDVDGLGGNPLGRDQLHLHGRMESPEDQRHGINQE